MDELDDISNRLSAILSEIADVMNGLTVASEPTHFVLANLFQAQAGISLAVSKILSDLRVT